MLLHLQQNQPPKGSPQGQHQIVLQHGIQQGIPSPETAGSSQQVSIQRAGGDPLKIPSGESSVCWQVSYYNSSIVLQYNILIVQNVPTCIALYQR